MASRNVICGILSEEDFVEAHQIHFRRYQRRQRLAYALIALAALITLAIGYWFVGFLLLGIGLLGLLLGGKLQTWLIRRSALRQFNQTKSLKDEYTYTWNAESLVASCSWGESCRPWRNYTRVVESPNTFLLYHNDIMFEVLPKKWFRDGQQVDEFRAQSKAGAA